MIRPIRPIHPVRRSRLTCSLPLLASCGILCLLTVAGFADEAETSAQVRRQFANPPREYATAPLWVWNDRMTDEKVVSTLRDLASQGVKQAFVHPRPGLITPYLSDEWFRAWKTALREAERLDMNIWIYDENSYPSGFAGGLVPEAMPEARGKRLVLKEVAAPPAEASEVLALFRLKDGGYEDVTAAYHKSQTLPKGRYLLATIQLGHQSGWYGGKFYVDLMKPGVTEKFLEITMGAYERHIGDQFGRRVPGVFTDEPHLAPAGGLHWSDHLPQLFEQRWGYDLVEHLPCLVRPVGDWKRVRHDYYQLLLEQFIERWSKPYYQYCEKHNLEFTGHYWEHDWPRAGRGGDMMALYAWHQRPAIDILMNRYSEDVHAQFGNVRAVMELASVANQFGRRRTLCETYGAGGWDLRFEDMKRIGDWVSVLGVNTIDEHLSYVTIRGARKRDHPQSFSYHEPWWEAYHVVARYLTRLSLVLSSGQQVNRILLFEPTTTTWMYQSDARMEQIGQRFQRLVTILAQRQVEFDIGSEYLMEQHGRVEGRALVIGQRRYDIVVLPEDVENLNSKTLELLNRYLAAGGLVLSCSPPPTRIDGRESDRGRALAEAEGFRRIKPDALPGELLRRSRDGFALVQDEGDQGILYHQRRQLDDGQFVFLVNTSLEAPCRGTLEAEAAGMERWNLHTGQVEAYPFRRTKGGVRARFELPPCGSLLLFLSREPVEPAQVARHRESRVKPAGPMQIERIAPNVLTLDYVDLSVRGKKMKGHYFFIAATLVFQNHGLHGNPWERSVQFRDELIRKTFPPDSGFSATYRFTIRSRVPQPLFIVIEQPELYSITCNGKPVKAEPGQWWLDKSFGVIDISEAARVGENAVTITARPLTIYHELEPAYVLGDFALKPTQAGFEIVPPQPIRFEKRLAHGNDPEGSMWLSAGIGYRRDPNAAKGNDRDPFVVFDLGRTCNLRGIRVWNYSEVNYTHRGVDELKILGSKTGQPDSFTIPIGTFRLVEATGDGLDFGQWLDVRADGVRYVQFDILSNHRGDRYPVKKPQQSHAFVGLSEVRFYAAKADQVEPAEIEGVRVHAFSSELKEGHNRLARFLVDGTGLSLRPVGWNRQGYPFYAAGVAYQQIFNVEQPAGRYVVRWKNWLGSVAKVVVNGELAGYVGWQPWQCDVTEHIRAGQNEVKVIVIGTLRNTLGPHHAGPVRGAAWPPAFQRGPRTGPPPGDAYHTLDYGLFEPFELVRQQ